MVNRQTGTAEQLRTQERVPEGTEFDFQISVRIFDDDDEDAIISLLEVGLEMLQRDYLGGSGSRGYGELSITYQVV
jgi:CRISPR-associated protein Csm3